MGGDLTGWSSKREHRRFIQAFVTTMFYFGCSSASTLVAATELPAWGGYYAPAYPNTEAGPFEAEAEAKSMALAYYQSPAHTYCKPLAPWPSELFCMDDWTVANITGINQGPFYSYSWTWYIVYDGQHRERLFGGFFYSSDWAVTTPGHIEVYAGVLLWEQILGGGTAVRVNYTCPNGYWLVGDPLTWQPGSPRPTCVDQELVVISPTSGSQYPLNQNDTTAVNITYQADDRPASTSQVNWTTTLDYATSGGRGTSQIADAFTSPAHGATVRNYQSQGGRLTISAWETTGSGTLFSRPNNYYVYIVGAPIADSAITSRLVGLYTRGATPNLLTGIASVESSYRQFTNRSLYGYYAAWPTESYDGGSHIGLMQMPVTMADAWDWHANTTNGANLFSEKLATARRIEGRISRNYHGLPRLTDAQIENMALVLYGPYASADLNMQYYVPQVTGQNAQWIVNTAGNPNGVAYADTVRASVR